MIQSQFSQVWAQIVFASVHIETYIIKNLYQVSTLAKRAVKSRQRSEKGIFQLEIQDKSNSPTLSCSREENIYLLWCTAF